MSQYIRIKNPFIVLNVTNRLNVTPLIIQSQFRTFCFCIIIMTIKENKRNTTTFNHTQLACLSFLVIAIAHKAAHTITCPLMLLRYQDKEVTWKDNQQASTIFKEVFVLSFLCPWTHPETFLQCFGLGQWEPKA